MRQGLETRAEIRSGITLAVTTDRGAVVEEHIYSEYSDVNMRRVSP